MMNRGLVAAGYVSSLTSLFWAPLMPAVMADGEGNPVVYTYTDDVNPDFDCTIVVSNAEELVAVLNSDGAPLEVPPDWQAAFEFEEMDGGLYMVYYLGTLLGELWATEVAPDQMLIDFIGSFAGINLEFELEGVINGPPVGEGIAAGILPILIPTIIPALALVVSVTILFAILCNAESTADWRQCQIELTMCEAIHGVGNCYMYANDTHTCSFCCAAVGPNENNPCSNINAIPRLLPSPPPMSSQGEGGGNTITPES